MKQAKENAFDCMIFDIMMPKMDGITALKIIRDSGDITPVLLLTAKAEMDDKVTGLDSGADDYLTKPFAMVELLARIRSLQEGKEDYTPKKLELWFSYPGCFRSGAHFRKLSKTCGNGSQSYGILYDQQ